MVTDPTTDPVLVACEAILAEKRAWLAALITETRNGTVRAFKRHTPAADDCVALTSHPFALVVTEDGAPTWSLQATNPEANGAYAMAYHTTRSMVLHLSAKEVVRREAWLSQTADSIRAQLKRPGIGWQVWAVDTLDAYDALCLRLAKRMQAIMDDAKR